MNYHKDNLRRPHTALDNLTPDEFSEATSV